MKTKKIIVIAVMLAAGIVWSFGCGGGDGDKEIKKEAELQGKIVFVQEVSKAGGETAEAPKTLAGKSITLTEEEKNKDKEVALFSFNLDGSGLERLTTKTSAMPLSGVAPNGDIFYATKAGIFITNAANSASRLLAGYKNIFSKFEDKGEDGLYWSDAVIEGLNEHVKGGFPFVSFVKKGDGYIAVIGSAVQYIKKGGEFGAALLLLRYDSATQSLERIFPFSTATKDLQFKVGDKPASLGGGGLLSFNDRSGKIIYGLNIGLGDSGRTLWLEYDPLAKTHRLFDSSLVEGTSMLGFDGDGCLLYQDPLSLDLSNGKCVEAFELKGPTENNPAQKEAEKKVVACMQNELAGKKIVVKCSATRDVTSNFKARETIVDLLDLTPAESKKIAEIDANIVEQFSSGNVYCDNTNKACRPSSEKSSIELPLFGRYSAYSEPAQKLSHMPFLGNIKDGDETRRAIYDFNLASGEVKLVDSDDSVKTIGRELISTQTSSGPIYFYSKLLTKEDERGRIAMDAYSSYSLGARRGYGYAVKVRGYDGSLFPSFLAYDPVSGKKVSVTGHVPYSLRPEGFVNYADKKILSTSFITYDNKYLFLSVTDDFGLTNVYKKSVDKIFSSENQAEAPAEQQAAEQQAEQQATTPLGAGWELAHPENKNINIRYDLVAYLGDMLIWSGNPEGFTYLYRNKINEPALKRFTKGEIGDNEDLISIVTDVQSFAPLASVVSFSTSQDPLVELACGGANPNGSYCPDWRQSCISKACVDLYSCSANNPSGACLDPDELCTNGTCNKVVCAVKEDCTGSKKCIDGSCSTCYPYCKNKECGDDGCGSSCGVCAAGKECDAYGDCVASKCIPNCVDKQCGADGCGGNCGGCPSGYTCNAEGHCQQSCKPNCTGKQCGPDGCAGTCGGCAPGLYCDAAGYCQQQCKPNCKGKQCGPDGCGGQCGTCPAKYTCSAVGVCEACKPNCTGKDCGPDGCGGSCGTCPAKFVCPSNGLCGPPCIPVCEGKQCGADGCGGTCGGCAPGFSCGAAGLCVACKANCIGKNCGPDGCGGSCGACAGFCVTGKCIPKKFMGDGKLQPKKLK